MACGDIAPIGG